MGWLKEKYTRNYFLQRDANGMPTKYGVYGIEYWENNDIYPEAKALIDALSINGSKILDIGFGRGETIRYCIAKGAAKVVGVDFSSDALDIAKSITLKPISSCRYILICDDIADFINRWPKDDTFDHIIMCDVIEHIPRSEVGKLLPQLFQLLAPGGTLVIHTPFYPEDDDVLTTGGKSVCKDSSDDFEETKGMHINRYSYHSLGVQLDRYGFKRWAPCIFLRPCNLIPIWLGPLKRMHGLARFLGYKIG